MTQSRQRESWNHTATLMAMLANVNRDPKKGRAFKPADFHPMKELSGHGSRPSRGVPLNKGNLKMLKAVFVDRRRCPVQGG